MKWFQSFIMALSCTAILGCVSQQAHEQALKESELSKEATAEKIVRLKQVAEEKQAEAVRLQAKNHDLQQAIDMREATVTQLQEIKENLEHAVEVQNQLQAQQLSALIQELDSLYDQIKLIEQKAGKPSLADPIFDVKPLNFDDLTAALRKIKASLDAQIGDISQLRKEKSELEKELSGMKARLQEMNRLKGELERVRVMREIQDAQLAKVNREAQTVSEEIDRITKTLEEKFGQSLVVTQHQDRLVITMLGQVLFESGEAELTPLGLKIMKKVGQVLVTLPDKFIQIEGHTDNNPIYGRLQQQYVTNWELSTARATSVLRFLIEQTKMDPKDFGAAGYADTRPVSSNENEKGRAQNRRVEIVIFPEQIVQNKEKIATIAR